MPCPLAGLRALTVLAAAALVAPLAVARPAPDPSIEPSSFHATGDWTRFRAFDGRECIPGDGSGAFTVLVTPLSEREVRVQLDGTARCESLSYERGIGGTWILEGRPAKGYSWENRAWCAFVRVGPLPLAPGDAWRVEAGDHNDVFGGCEVFEGTARRDGESALSPLIGDATTRP